MDGQLNRDAVAEERRNVSGEAVGERPTQMAMIADTRPSEIVVHGSMAHGCVPNA